MFLSPKAAGGISNAYANTAYWLGNFHIDHHKRMTQIKREAPINNQALANKIDPYRTRRKTTHFPRAIYILFFIFTLYLVIPVIDIPLLGLSLSAPMFFFIAVVCIFTPPHPWFKKYSKWILLAVLTWFGIFISTTANGLVSLGVNIDNEGVITLIRYLYWILVFVITAYFANQDTVLETVATILAWSILLLALLRWGEVILYNNAGAWTGTHLMTQNSYGFQFSTFSPFILIKIFQQRGGKKIFWILAMLVVWSAAAINSSRGSWVAIGIGLAVCLLMFFFSRPRKMLGTFLIILVFAGVGMILWNMIPEAAEAIEERASSFQSLGEDKSYVIRQVMVQKGLRLFQESPIIGVGANRFTMTWTDLEIPDLLATRSIQEFETKNSHNSYIQFLAEFGLVGSIPFGLLLLILVFSGFKTSRKSIIRNNLIPLAFFLSFIQMSIHMWVITALTGTITWFIYGLMAAVIMRGSQLSEKKAV